MKFSGERQYPTDMLPVSFRKKHMLGLLFRCEILFTDDIHYEPDEISMDTRVPPGRRDFDSFMRGLNERYGNVDQNIMREIFPGFPTGPIEEWAIDYNDLFYLEFTGYYDASSVKPVMIAKALGETNVHWTEYADTYCQALTMEKLRSGL